MPNYSTDQQKVKEITDKLEQGLKELFESEKYKSYLNTMSKFHNYSFNNTLLIALQKPDATLVAGYQAWQKNFERHVNKGEKGIRILAPAPYKITEERDKLDPITGDVMLDNDGMPQKEEVEVTIPAFRAVSVFDVSQTDGKPIPELETKELLASVDGYEDFMNALRAVSPVPIEYANIPGGAYGYFSQEEKKIVVQEGLSESQTLKTTIHEVAHSKLHDRDLNAAVDSPVKDRNTKEVEAESVAYTVCQHFGIDTSEYSFSYVAGWSSGKQMQELKSSLDTIRKTASELITEIETQLRDLQRERETLRDPDLEKLLLIQDSNLSEYSLLSVRGMEAEEIVSALSVMNDNDKLNIAAFLESKGAWVSEIANQDTKEWREYHLDVRYLTDKDQIIDLSAETQRGEKAEQEQTASSKDLSPAKQAEEFINRLEYNKTLFSDDERNLIVNHAYKIGDAEKTKALAERLYREKENGGGASTISEMQAEIDALPDTMVGISEMNEYGYEWVQMLPLTQEMALELFDAGLPVYLLHTDGAETLVEGREQLEFYEGMCGIEKADWERGKNRLEITQEIEENSVNTEAQLLYGSKDKYGIYQMKDELKLFKFHFEGTEALERMGYGLDPIKPENYDLRYVGDLSELRGATWGETLEAIYEKFNIAHPKDFRGHSLSVSDIVVLHENGENTAHFVDSIGFTEVPVFLEAERESSLSLDDAAELAFQIGDRYLMIHESDGGYDYSILGLDYKEIDGGLYENLNVSIYQAAEDIAEDLKTPRYNKQTDTFYHSAEQGNIGVNDELILVDYETLEEKMEEANRIEPSTVVADFKEKTKELFREIADMNPDEIEETIKCHVQAKIDEYGLPAEIVDVAITGTRCRGLERYGSDLDVVVELSTHEREDDLFSAFNEDGLHIGGIKVDINPITTQRTGTLETYLPQVEAYLDGVREAREQEPISLFNIRMNDDERWYRNTSGLDVEGLCRAYAECKLPFVEMGKYGERLSAPDHAYMEQSSKLGFSLEFNAETDQIKVFDGEKSEYMGLKATLFPGKEVEVTLTVAECGEFHNLGAYYEGITTVEEALKLFEGIPSERLNGVPAIGIQVHVAGQEPYQDTQIDIYSGQKFDLDILSHVPEISTEDKAVEMVAELISRLPEAEITGEMTKELQKALEEYKPLAKIEEVEEQNYNMIDNVLNNGAGEKDREKKEKVEQVERSERPSLKGKLEEKRAAASNQSIHAQSAVNDKNTKRLTIKSQVKNGNFLNELL